MKRFLAAALGATLASGMAHAQAPATPKLIVAISIDQYSSDIFNEYRAQMTGGIKRLMDGVVFPSGFQSHAATETCPGHSTILTGSRPSRNGIIANEWFDPASTRTGPDGRIDYKVYCSEDERVPGTNSRAYVVSPLHLKVPTLGDRMKAVTPASRVVAVAGKDRSAVMMSGHNADQVWWWEGKGFTTYRDRPGAPPAAIARANAVAQSAIDKPVTPKLPPACAARNFATPIEGGSVGTLQPRKAGDARGFRASADFDRAVLAGAEGLFADMKLGRGAATDVLAIGLSATDYVGHTWGTAGGETCVQLHAVDALLGKFFAMLDKSGVPYAVALTADHGGHDLPERNRTNAIPAAKRVGLDPNLAGISAQLSAKYGIPGPVLIGDGIFGEIYLSKAVPPARRDAVIADARTAILAHPDVQTVFTRAQLSAIPSPSGSPADWTLEQRARASFDPDRSGELVIALKELVTPIPSSGLGYVATHGSIWNYDRRVPILFWQKGLRHFEQPNGVETVDILPTLASLIGLAIPAGEIDGRCLDLVAGAGSNCP